MKMNLVYKALADPTRRDILNLLKNRDLTAGEIADHFRISKPSISHHHEPLPPSFHEEVGVSYHLHRRSFCTEEGGLLPLDECIGSLLDGSSKQHRHHTDGAVQPFYYFLLTQSVDTSASFVRSSV
jgi:DNA-binding transcriptional ArsR family regulator